MNLDKSTREKLYRAQGKPITITWPLDAPEPHGGKRYAVHGEDGSKLFSIRLERSKRLRSGETRADVKIDDDPVRVLPGLQGVRIEDGSYETEPERVDEAFEKQRADEGWLKTRVCRAEHTGQGKLASEYAARESRRAENPSAA